MGSYKNRYIVLVPEILKEDDIMFLGEDVDEVDKRVWKEVGSADTLQEAAKIKRSIYDETGVIATIMPVD